MFEEKAKKHQWRMGEWLLRSGGNLMWNYSNVQTPMQLTLTQGRVLVWFSCGAASAVASKLAIEKYSKEKVEILYCNTLAYEHPDNKRFIQDIERWLGCSIKILNPQDYTGYKDIFDVFDRSGWLVGPGGARCSTELKKRVRQKYQNPDDLHIFGMTADEEKRIKRFQRDNFDLYLDWILLDAGYDKQKCFSVLRETGIELPAMYKLGYKNNNCIGCVKGSYGYWNKIRKDFPEYFQRMAEQERKMNVHILSDCFLDELQEGRGRYEVESDIECGPQCGLTL
jgi:hypothetical protein